MHERLLGYLLGALESEEQAQVEELLQTVDQVQKQAEMLRRGLEPLEGDDHEELHIPSQLAARTCRLVREIRMSGELRREWP